jgi:Domain of unknown function (DUF932)
MELNSLNWAVEKVKLTDNGISTPYYALKRSDNGNYLSQVSNSYKVVQNQDLLKICQDICNNTGYELFNEMSLNDGKRVMISVKTGDFKVGDDLIHSMVNVINSHDKTACLSFYLGNITLRCSNQFSKILNQSQFKFTHDGNLDNKLNQMLQSLSLFNKIEKEHYDILHKFQSTNITKDLAMKQLGLVLDILDLESEEISTRKKNQLDLLEHCYNLEQADLDDTLYTLVNACTRYCTHEINQVHWGTGLAINNNIFNNCLNLV